MLRAPKVIPAIRARRGFEVTADFKEPKGMMALKVRWEAKDHRVLSEIRAHRGSRVTKGPKATRALKARYPALKEPRGR